MSWQPNPVDEPLLAHRSPLTATARAWCDVALPDHAMSDTQVAGEYVARAIRTTARKADRRISVLGYSQGGMLPRRDATPRRDIRAGSARYSRRVSGG